MRAESELVGTLVGSYRITGELGRGGMGTVYRAEHVVLERPVAIKLLRAELTADAELMSRFITEAKAASAIQHPGIIEVLDFGHASDGRAYLVMEMLEGQSLAKRIATRGRLPEREAVRIARDVAAALVAAHGKGIVHRDLKPDNVFLIADPDLGERPKVLDFGIAKLLGGAKQTQTGALIGTPLYMAPEQARAASQIDHRADLYSLGCMLYEMLVGAPPFSAVGAGELIALHVFETPVPPSQRTPGLSPAIDEIVMRLLEKQPSDRFGDAAELAAALDRVLGGVHRDVAPELPPTASVTARTPRSRAVGTLAGLAVTGVAIGVAAVLVLARGDDGARPTPARVDEPAVAPDRTSPAVGAPRPEAEPEHLPAPSAAAPVAVPDSVRDSTPARARREKARSSKASAPKYTKDGSPIEIDLD